MAADTAHSNDATAKALNMLKRIRRLEGTALISGGVLLHDDCPRGTDGRLFSQAIVQMFDGLEEAGEYGNDILLSFDGGELLLMFRYPVVLCLFFNRDEDIGSVEKGGNQFLNQFSSALGIQSERPRSTTPVATTAITPATTAAAAPAEPTQQAIVQEAPDNTISDQEAWVEFRRQVEMLFTKVLGSAQASRTITRELAAMGIKGDDSFLRKAQFRPFGQKLTSRIKDRQIRRQIDDELISIVDSLV